MDVRLSFNGVLEEDKVNFVPKKGRLTMFEQWSMLMAYACLAHDSRGDTSYKMDDVLQTCVWDGNYLHNTEWQIHAEDGEQSRLWLSENGVLMLEVYSDDINRQSKLYWCD